jgi:L-2,4-diaminobutyrate decarboxylase
MTTDLSARGLLLVPDAAGDLESAVAAAARAVEAGWSKLQGPTSGCTYEQLRTRLEPLDLSREEGVGLPSALDEITRWILPHTVAVGHPEYAAHLHATPAIAALAAEVIISATNQSLDSFDQAPSATAVERHVLAWLLSVFGFGVGGDGVFTNGATKSNLMGLLLARDEYARERGWNVRRSGLPSGAGRWRILCSELAHFSIDKAAGILGIGEESVIRLPADDRGAIRPETIRRTIRGERDRGNEPIALALTAGTTDLGSIDPIADGVSIAHEHGIWAHVDAAAGGALMLSDTRRHLLEGIQAADSVAVDFHKLLFQPISCGVFLVRRASALEHLHRDIPYLDPNDGEVQVGPNLVSKSLETTRRFDALKVLLTMRALGRARIAALLEQTFATSRLAAEAIEASERLALLVQPVMSIVLFRWRPSRRELSSDARVERVNRALPSRLRSLGGPAVGGTVYRGAPALKLTLINPLCTGEHVRRILSQIESAGEDLHNELSTLSESNQWRASASR